MMYTHCIVDNRKHTIQGHYNKKQLLVHVKTRKSFRLLTCAAHLLSVEMGNSIPETESFPLVRSLQYKTMQI